MTNDTYHSFSYDAEGHVVSVDGGASTGTINALGEGVQFSNAAGGGANPYDANGQLLGLYTFSDSSWTDFYVYLGGRQVAWLAQANEYLTRFIHTNNLGSTTQPTDQLGGVGPGVQGKSEDLLWYPFGAPWTSWGSWGDTVFAGMLPCYGCAEYGTPNRSYSPAQGRWLRPDPLAGDITNPQSLNRYAYVLNNPTGLVDPLGLDPKDPCDRNPTSRICTGFNDAFGSNAPGIFAPGLDEFDLALLGLLPGTSIYSGFCPAQFASCVSTPGGYIGFDNAGNGTAFSFAAYQTEEGLSGVVTETINGVQFVFQRFLDSPSSTGTSIGPYRGPQPKQPDTRPSCSSVFVNSLFSNPPEEQAIEQGAKAASQAFATASLTYQMRQLLVVPLRSSIVRGINGIGDILGIAGEASPYLFAAATVLPAEYTSAKANVTGACQNNFW
jgi:RHS repeat-associated protein